MEGHQADCDCLYLKNWRGHLAYNAKHLRLSTFRLAVALLKFDRASSEAATFFGVAAFSFVADTSFSY